MTAADDYDDLVEEIYASIETIEQAKEAMRNEAARLNLTLAQMLDPVKARELLESRQSPVLQALFLYFRDDGWEAE